MMATMISQSDLAALVENLVADKVRVIAPVRAKDNPAQADYLSIRSLEEASLGGPLPRRSLKEFFLPASEVLLHYRQGKNDVELEEVRTTFGPRVILGARPCDAAGIEVLDRVMGWDYRDELWFGRREATTLVSLACSGADASCFCTAVGLGPDSTKGSDVLLIPSGDGYLAQAITAKGEALLNRAPLQPSDDVGGVHNGAPLLPPLADVGSLAREQAPQNLIPVPSTMPEWLATHFNESFWSSIALRCHGCGACASICPTCHCFDIVDEHESYKEGVRRRNWDSCQTSKFTLHASNYNPRKTQIERFRQRVMHKFSIYPRRFGALLCTGCGRCARACPAGMNLPEVLGQLIQLAGAPPQGGSQ